MSIAIQNENNLVQESQANKHYLIEHNKKLKCICQLCTCGKHKCPRPKIKGYFQTSYKRDYKANQFIQPPISQQLEYNYQQRHYNPDALKTNYQQNYIKNQPPSPSRFQNIAMNVIVPHVPFVGSSSYKQQYKPFVVKNIDPNPQSVHNNNYVQHSPVKFEGISSYKDTFTVPPAARIQPKQNYYQYTRNNVPFYGHSSYKQQYPGYKIQAKKHQSQQQLFNINKKHHVKFDAHTSYKDQFQPYQVKLYPQQYNNNKNPCQVEKITVPTMNYINDGEHIFYDPQQRKFV